MGDTKAKTMKEFSALLQKRFLQMCKTNKLFVSSISGQRIWNIYLQSFQPEDDPVFRDPESSTHNCNLCNNFIRRYGNIVAIDPNTYELMSIWDIYDEVVSEYHNPCKKLSETIQKSFVDDIFIQTYSELNSLPYEKTTTNMSQYQLGMAYNVKRYTKEEAEKYGVVKPDEIRRFNHFHLFIPKERITFGSASAASLQSEARANKQVFLRALEDIPLDTLELVRDLINQNSLLNGKAHLQKVEDFIQFKKTYDKLASNQKENWCWYTSYNLPIAKFRNELIGVLCIELAEGKEINEACKSWNIRVDPINYMKAVAPITKKQIQEAERFVEEQGYTESFDRRHATIDDIKASEIKHINVGSGEIKNVSMFDDLKKSVSTRHKRSEFDKVEEVTIDQFLEKILPTATGIEVFLTSEHENNIVSLTTSKNPNSKPIFKWNNNYSWTFKGNLAGKSEIKEAVKLHGGDVTGVLRFSIKWSDPETKDNSDLDAWAREPGNVVIGFRTPYRKDRGSTFSPCSGQLDVDITSPFRHHYVNVVENIVYKDIKKMKNGNYQFWVNPFSRHNSVGFSAEIEMNGEIYEYHYPQPVNRDVTVAIVHVKDGTFSITHKLPESTTSKLIYGLETNQFHKVDLVCLSPNYWDENAVGNKHYFFMLQNCKVTEPIRGFHNENLIADLQPHRKVLDVFANYKQVPPNNNQLSGLGFNATVRDSLIVRVLGSFKRVIKIKF